MQLFFDSVVGIDGVDEWIESCPMPESNIADLDDFPTVW